MYISIPFVDNSGLLSGSNRLVVDGAFKLPVYTSVHASMHFFVCKILSAKETAYHGPKKKKKIEKKKKVC